MSLIPEYKYSAGPGYLNLINEEVIKAGYETGELFLFRELIDLDLSGINSSYTSSNPKLIHTFTLDNGVELRFYAYYDNGHRAAGFKAYYNDVEFTSTQYQQSGINTGMAGEVGDFLYIDLDRPYGSAALESYPCKMAVQTFYPNPSTENVTPATSFGFALYVPSYRVVNDVRIDNDLSSFQTDFLLTRADLVNIPYEGSYERVDFLETGWQLFNLTQTSNYMKTAGQGTDKDITGGSNKDRDPEDDNSGTGGGGGSYDPTSDPIDFPTLPTGGAMTSGMLKGFVIGTGALVQLQQKLWDMSIFDITTQFQKLVNQPLDCLISLHCLPVLPDTAANPENVKLGSFDTEVQASRISNQYKSISGGTLAVPKYWGSALDYAPFSRCEIFLPFIGIRNLEIEDIQGTTLTIKYHVDVLTGDCVAYIKCGQSVLYSFTGNCLSHIPCTSQTSDLLAKGIAAVGSIGVGMVAGNPASAAAGVISAATNVVTAKNHVQRSGDVAGSPGIMSEFTPYLIFHRPKQSLAKNYNKFKGYPSNITYTLSSLTGYTEVEHVHLTGISGATDAELNEIEKLLKEGVII